MTRPDIRPPDAGAVCTMFARIAPRYDAANRLLSGGIDLLWRRRLVRMVARHAPLDVLDLATGSGDVALSLSRKLPPEARIVGMDFCLPMLEQAEAKKAASGPGAFANVSFRPGDGLALPLPDAAFDVATIAFGLRNLADRARGLAELRRVIRPGGRLIVLEFSRPSAWLRPAYSLYLRHILPAIAGWLTGDREAYAYLNSSIEQFPDAARLAVEITAAGFYDVQVHRLTGCIVALHEATAPGSIKPA
jgi:demethylmenaquinone methyltransferase/2-methoxy-6-polyprenyl-1,4-benzoquinol methylase